MSSKSVYFKTKDESVFFVGNYMEVYLPANLFKTGVNQYIGNVVSVMGIFNYRIFNKEGDKPKLQTFKFPSVMETRPNTMDELDMELIPGQGVQRYVILKYFKDSAFILKRDVVASIDNVELFMKLFNEGKLPNTIKYDDILDLMLKNLEINQQNLNVSATLYSVLVSERYRYKEDLSIPLRKVIGKGKCSQYDYVAANSRTICSYNSTFSALTFEDPDSMLVTSINKKRYGRKENYTPIEKIIQ